MAGAGNLRDRVTFVRFGSVDDGQGGYTDGWSAIAGLSDIRGAFRPERSRERLAAGRLESSVAGTLSIRSFEASRGVTAADRVIINADPYVIHAITNPDRRDRYLEMTVERGTGQV